MYLIQRCYVVWEGQCVLEIFSETFPVLLNEHELLILIPCYLVFFRFH
jgi:hypothetical protein